MLIRLHGCAGWSVPLLLAYETGFLMAWLNAQMDISLDTLYQTMYNKPILTDLSPIRNKTIPESWGTIFVKNSPSEIPRCLAVDDLPGVATFELPHDKTHKMTFEPSEDSDQPVHLPSLIRVFAVRMKKLWVLSYPIGEQRSLIRLGRCPGWSESSLGAQVIVLVLS